MKSLRIRPQVFKHLDSNTELTIDLISGIKGVQLNPEHSYKLKIKNNTGYLTEYDLEIKGNQLVLTTDKLKDFTPDDYEVEVWDSYEDKDSIYPDEDYGTFKIDKNVAEVDGETIPVITIEDFEKRFDEAIKNAKGDKGERGPQGLPGPVGPQGPKGERGEVGPKGEKGDTGLQGSKGDKGDKGDTGERGADGKDGTNGIDGKNGQDGKSAYQIWLDLGNSGSEQDFINSLKPKVERHAPTGYTLDTSTKPWTIWFDNGCGLQLLPYWNNKAFYSYGSTSTRIVFFIYDHPKNIIYVSNGSITDEDIRQSKKIDGNWSAYWNEQFIVINPIHNRDDYDWSNVKMNDVGDVGNQKWIARTLYELGIWSGEVVESFGAVRKAGN